MPFIVELLKIIAKTGHVEDLIETATFLRKLTYEQAAEAQNERQSADKF